MNISLRHLRLVSEVAREGTLTGAAKRLYLTQSALSHQLADLERQIGGPVFTRVGRRMVPTAAGLRIVDAAGSMLNALDTLTEDLRAIADGRLGRLRVTTMCYTAYHWLPAVLPRFRALHPGVEFEIVPDAASRPLEALLNGEVDLALMTDTMLPRDLFSVPLFEDDQVLIVAPDHPLAERSFVTAQEISELHLLVYRDDGRSTLNERVLTPAGLSPRRVSEVRTTEGIVALVEAGIGAAAVTRWSVAPHVQAGRVAALRVTEFGLRRQWHALALQAASECLYMIDFVALLQRGPGWIFDARDDGGLRSAPVTRAQA